MQGIFYLEREGEREGREKQKDRKREYDIRRES
jgi:hypothetical protein